MEVLLRAVNLQHETHSFTSLPKEVILRIFTVGKNPSTPARFTAWQSDGRVLVIWMSGERHLSSHVLPTVKLVEVATWYGADFHGMH